MPFDGLLLREVRRRRALTIRELGERSGVHRDTIHRIELGETDPRPSTIRKLADALARRSRRVLFEPGTVLGKSGRLEKS